MKDRGEVVRGEDLLEYGSVADVSQNADEVRVIVRVEDEVDIGAGVTLGKQSALEDAAEETGSAGDENMSHISSMVLVFPASSQTGRGRP